MNDELKTSIIMDLDDIGEQVFNAIAESNSHDIVDEVNLLYRNLEEIQSKIEELKNRIALS